MKNHSTVLVNIVFLFFLTCPVFLQSAKAQLICPECVFPFFTQEIDCQDFLSYNVIITPLFGDSTGTVIADSTYEYSNDCYNPVWQDFEFDGNNAIPVVQSHMAGEGYCFLARNKLDTTETYLISLESVSCNTPLSIELLDFSGEALTDNNHLTWSTASTTNETHFILERSLDGQEFTEIALIPIQSDNMQKRYEHFDHSLAEEYMNIYYRLKTVDTETTINVVSDVILVERNRYKNNSLSIYPNPAYNQLHVSFATKQVQEANIIIYDAVGKQQIRQAFISSLHNNQVSIDIDDLAKGLYFLQVGEMGMVRVFVKE